MKTIWTDRSRVEQFSRCPRSRYLAYHQDGIGLSPIKLPLPLAVGLAVHTGLEWLLKYGAIAIGGTPAERNKLEDSAVAYALADFRQYQDALALDLAESQAIAPTQDMTTFGELLGGDADAMAAMSERVGESRSRFDRYLAAEQSALVEAMVRAYARRRLRPLLEAYEVLEVEREGQWKLAEWTEDDATDAVWFVFTCSCGHTETQAGIPVSNECSKCARIGRWQVSERVSDDGAREIWFMSRPDALLRERATDQLYILSYKTTAGWDVRRAKSAEHDMQGLSEGIEVERRLSKWWEEFQTYGPDHAAWAQASGTSVAMADFLSRQSAPPRILAIRYEYLIKGERWKDKDLSASLGIEVRSQRSVLVRGYRNAGMAAGDEQWNYAWDYIKDTGETSKLYWKTWRSSPVWESMPIKKWIDMLDETCMVVNAETGTERGYGGPAQSTGYTATHPLEDVFLAPIMVYRNEDELRDLVDQIEAQERRVAEGVEVVASASDDGERRHELNVHFPMNRHSCFYPSTCIFVELCYAGEDIRKRPLDSGLYMKRRINHAQEVEAK